MKEIRIRFALPEDVEGICNVQRAAVSSLQGGPYASEIVEAWAAAQTPKAVLEGMKTPDMTWFVAESAGRVVGFGAMYKSEVRAIYVHPDYQGMGIGSKLLGKVEAEAKRRGIYHLTLFASLNARHFYDAHGYRVMREMLVPLNEEESMTTLAMEKELPR